MSMELRTKILEQDEGFRLARRMLLNVKAKEVMGPKRALSASRGKVRDETSLKDQSVRGLVEIYKRVSGNKLKKMIRSNKELHRFEYDMNFSLKNVNEDEISVVVMELSVKGKPHTDKEVELIVDLLNNPRFDIVVVPILPKVKLMNYLGFLKNFLEARASTTFFPALVPAVPHYSIRDINLLFEELPKFSLDLGFIAVDFNGGNPISQYSFVSHVVRRANLLSREVNKPVFLYALNLKHGKATKRQEVIPAKELLVFAMGFDAFGTNHKGVIISRDYGVEGVKSRVLNREDYGYYTIELAGDRIKERDGYEIELSQVLSDPKFVKLYNAERQAREVGQISLKIKEKEYERYIRTKRLIKEDLLKKISKVQERVAQSLLG